MFLFEVTDALESAKIRYAVVGGYALALHGIVRATMDVDIVISLKLLDFERAERSLEKIQLKSRLPIRAKDVIKFRVEYIEKRNLIAWSFVDYQNPTRQVDILITEDVSEFKIEKVSVVGRKIPVVSLQDLLVMKSKSARPQDLVDIENIRIKIDEKKKVNSDPTPLQALQFLESMRLLAENKDEPTVMISLRVPGNILKTIKKKAQIENKKYQSLIVELLRSGLKK